MEEEILLEPKKVDFQSLALLAVSLLVAIIVIVKFIKGSKPKNK